MNLRVLLASLLLITSCVWAETPLTSEQLYQQAYDNFTKRDYNAASASLDKINAVDQKKADVLNLRGAIYKRLGELDNAANAYNDALKINPKDWVPKYNLAEVNFLREQYKSSRTFLEQALASMPESDRLQKQDLILYKVYLTYLLQGDDDKAKLLLDSFDVNSANPVYYFAQAAWSYKKKDTAKAKTWVDSTEGIYSADLRNSYSQALVDIGWLEPAAGVGAVAVSASPSPSASPEVVAVSSPSPATPEVVPLASSSATPLAVNAVSPSPTPTLSATPAPSIPANVAAVVPSAPENQRGAPWKTLLGILVVLAVAAVALINLARRSRIVPEPVDNTGYAAIAASGDPEAASLGSHHSEGTGAVIVQEDESPAPTPIKITPIHREYEADAVPVAAPTLVTATAVAASSRKKESTKSSGKSVPTPATVKPAAKVPVKKTPLSTPTSAPAPAPAKKKAPAKSAAPVAKSAEGARPIRLVPVPTINVPPVDESQRKRIVVSEIEKIVIKKAGSSKKAAPTPVAAIEPAPIAAQPKVTPVAKKKPVPAKKVAKAPASKPKAEKPATAPVITIPEFEEISENQPTRTVIRLTPDENPGGSDENKPQGT